MIYLIQASITTLGVMLYEILYRKKNHNPFSYIFIFVACFLFSYLCGSYLYSKDFVSYDCALTQDQRDYYFWKVHHHYNESSLIHHNVESWFETIHSKLSQNDYHLVNAALNAVATGIATKNLASAAVASAIIIIHGILNDLTEVTKQIITGLFLTRYHIEMAEFYQDVLASDGG